MLGESGSCVLGSSVDAVEVSATSHHQHDGSSEGGNCGGAASSSAEEDITRGGGGGGGERIRGDFGGNRWPRQETLALLKIRSDMDVAFRDASAKGPLWDEVSRKLAELGYHRNAKKCKEKFENLYKYHKRTKEGRSGKPDGKTYRFFDQLQALENQPPPSIFHTTTITTTTTTTTPHDNTLYPKPPPQQPQVPPPPPPPSTVAAPPNPQTLPLINPGTATAPSTSPQPMPSILTTLPSFPQPNNHVIFARPPQQTATPPATTSNLTNSFQPSSTVPVPPFTFANISTDLISNSTSSNSSTSSDGELSEGPGIRRTRKRKWKEFFGRLMKEVIQKQEDLQKRFLEAIEKREHERMAREEAWRLQEMAKLNREREILAQERSMAAAKDAAVMAFLQKVADQQPNQNPSDQVQIKIPLQPPPQPAPASSSQAATPQSDPPPPPRFTTITHVLPQQNITVTRDHHEVPNKGDHDNFMMISTISSSRWPKVEVQALIKLRADLDTKYQENGPKGLLWEEISTAMKNLGYNRNAKRCKEKWENINKYFKKVKESNKKRPEDSKTCPYFHQLDALYKEKNKLFESSTAASSNNQSNNSLAAAPMMVRPEQQWPPQQEIARPESGNEDMESEALMDQQHGDGEKDVDDDSDGSHNEEEEQEEDEGGGHYEIVASKPGNSSVGPE